MYKATVVLRKDGIREIKCKDFSAANGVLFMYDVVEGNKTNVFMFPLDTVLQVKADYVEEPRVS